jgi:chromosome segregation ATPase
VEEYRLELVRESNQHAAETGEKISELRAQLSASQAETAGQKSRLEAEIARLQMDNSGREPAAAAAAAASWEEITAERDGLREKNEKLKVMCKKYVAKLKQLESQQQLGGQSPLSTTSRSDRDGSEAEGLVEQLKAEVAALNEIVANNNAALAALEANFAACLAQLDAKTEEAERWERDAAEQEAAALTAKDDLIRELKEKLEAAPENITVPLLVEDPAEAAKAKAELAAITEKYKKLIVKVRQQNELLKKGRSSVASGSGAEEEAGSPSQRGSAGSEEQQRLLREETERCAALAMERDALSLEKQTISDQLAETVASMNELRTENAELRQRISAEADRQSAVESLTARVERMVAERTALYETQTELKEEIQVLKQARQAGLAAAERLEAEVRRMREANIVSQMQASSLLQVPVLGTMGRGFVDITLH